MRKTNIYNLILSHIRASAIDGCLTFVITKRSPNDFIFEYLKKDGFSVLTKTVSTDGKQYNTRIFNEDGIYEITFLAKTKKARKFRSWVRTLLKSLRRGELQLSQNNVAFSPDIIEAIIQKYLPRINNSIRQRFARGFGSKDSIQRLVSKNV